MSDDPITVPEGEQTEEQKAEQEKQFAQADLLKELTEQLRPKSASMLQNAKSLGHDATKDQIQAVADEIDQVAQAGRNAQGRMDSLDCSHDSAFYKATQNLWEYCDLAHHDAKEAAQAAGDNDEVRDTAISNMLQNLEHADGQIQQA
jgi:hypothetical protein